VVFVLAVAALAAADSAFDAFIKKYNKPYANDLAEYAKRSKIFNENLRVVNMHRQSLAKNDVEPWMGVTRFSDMTPAEFKQSGYVQRVSVGADARSCLANGVELDVSTVDLTDIPPSWDWRTKNVVSPVQDQGQCGSCWTFATVATIESAAAIATGTLIKLSEQEIVDCSHGCVLEDGQQVCNEGCNGGWPWSAMEDVISWGGLETEDAYPYTATTDTCTKQVNLTHNDPIKNYTCLSGPDLANETVMAAFVAANGPIAIAMDATLLQSYSKGIIKPDLLRHCSKTQLDHAIVIVGYGSEGSEDFWIVRNSWGATWGEDGYFRIIRGKGACGINAGVIFPVVKTA